MSKKNPITVSSWTLGDQCKFEDRVIAAKEAGYEGIGLRAETYVDALNEGLHDEDILAILDKHDMKVTEVEYIVQWCEEHRSYEQKYKEQMCFHMCELFGVGHINCGLMENYSVEYTAQKLKELCQRAGKYIIGVEPMPYSGIPNLQKGWEVVKASGCENAMLILDTWHWVRANQPYDILTPEIAKKVISIQINDAYERPYADSILRDESMHDRLAPGTGAKDTAGFVKMIKDAGVDPKVIGVEVISDEILGRGLKEAAAYTYENTEKVLKANIKPKRRNRIEYFDLHPEIPLDERNNYHIDNNNLGIGTPKQKFRRNVEAIKILKQCNEENRYATQEEQQILAEYVGWGGLADAFDPQNDGWSEEYKELKSLLTEKEYSEARQSTLTAFYTPPVVISSIYKALEKMGLEKGNILEPSCRSW